MLNTASVLVLIEISFYLIFQVAKFFHIAHAVTITLGAFLTYQFSVGYGFSLEFAIPTAICAVVLINISIELGIYKPLRKKKTSSWMMLISSLGLYVILQNLVSIIWGDGTKSIRTWPVRAGHSFCGAHITNVQILVISVSVLVFVSTMLFLHYTRFGKQIRAVASNVELSRIFGISSDKVIFLSFVFGSAIGALSGILIALDLDMNPTMGFHIFLYAVVAMIVGGLGSYVGLVGGALLLSIALHISTYFLSGEWMDATAFFILILFLIWKPLGFSGKRLKKVEI